MEESRALALAHSEASVSSPASSLLSTVQPQGGDGFSFETKSQDAEAPQCSTNENPLEMGFKCGALRYQGSGSLYPSSTLLVFGF